MNKRQTIRSRNDDFAPRIDSKRTARAKATSKTRRAQRTFKNQNRNAR